MTLNGRGLSQPPPFLSRMTLRMPFLQERRPPHSSWPSSSETPVWMHNTNATVDVSPYNGISAILGQHKDCAQIAMIMNGCGLSPPPPFELRSLYTHTSYHLTWHTAPMMHCSHKLATMSSYSGCPLRLFPNEPSRIRLCRTVPRMLAYLATTWRSRQYLLLPIPESKNASTVMYATSITISGSKNAKIQSSEATWQNSPTRKCARPKLDLKERPHNSSPRFYYSARQPRTGNPGSPGCHRRYGLRCRSDYSPSPRYDPPSCQCPNGRALGFHRLGAR